MSAPDRIGGFTAIVPPLDRQLAMDAFAAVPSGHPMIALLELDVGDARTAIDALRRRGERVSLFAFVVHAIATALSEHPELNTIRHGRRLVRFEDVDVSIPIEVRTPDGDFPREVVIRRAQDLGAREIYAELEAARARYGDSGDVSGEDRRGRKLMRAIRWLPKFVRVGLIRALIGSAFRVKRGSGTTLVTSVGKFAAIPGFAFTFSTGPRAAIFVIGGVVKKPWLVDTQLTSRPILSLSVMVDHDLVDGAPAARFVRRLQELVESADGLSAE